MQSTRDQEANCARAHQLIDQASHQGARLIALPEYFLGLGAPAAIVAQAQDLDGPLLQAFRAQAQQLQIYLLLGTIPERSRSPAKSTTRRCSWVRRGRSWPATENCIFSKSISPAGSVSGNRPTFSRAGTSWPSPCRRRFSPWGWPSATISGSPIVPGPRGPGSRDYPSALGLFPGHRQGPLGDPAPGPGHGKQGYILAPAQSYHPDQSLKTYGRSLIVDPWGLILARPPTGRRSSMPAWTASTSSTCGPPTPLPGQPSPLTWTLSNPVSPASRAYRLKSP